MAEKPPAVSVKVDHDQWEALRKLAEERDRHIGGELRRAIRFYLEAQAK